MRESTGLIRLGWSLLALIFVLTPFLVRKVKFTNHNNEPTKYTEGIEGKSGNLRETYEDRQITLSYDSISTRSTEIFIKPARITFEDQSGKWFIEGASAVRKNGQWIIFSPLTISFRTSNNFPIGEGLVSDSTACLLWARGEWQGLTPIFWKSRSSFLGGVWIIPKGWIRRLDGSFESKMSPVTFQANEKNMSKIESLQAESISSSSNINEIFLTRIQATVFSGTIRTSRAVIINNEINFPTEIAYDRNNELSLRSDHATYRDTGPSSTLVLSNVRGSRIQNKINETVRSDMSTIYPDLSRYSGHVEWARFDGSNITKIKSPDIYIRERTGASQPNDLEPDELLSPDSTEVIFNDLKFVSKTLRLNKKNMTWSMGPVIRGENKDGIYMGKLASGDRDVWKMQGPIKYELNNNQGALAANQLIANKFQWTMSGQPIRWEREKDVILTSTINKLGDLIKFPSQLQGTFHAPQGDIVVDASGGFFESNILRLGGPILVNGLGWSCSAPKASIGFDNFRRISNIKLEGGVSLKGSLGEGEGERLEITLKPNDKTYTIHWQGRVRGANKLYE